ncbi:tetranectin-like protein [Discoglossus pictus]
MSHFFNLILFVAVVLQALSLELDKCPSLNGRDGRDGAPGLPGLKGDPGHTGQTGAPGSKGNNGAPGKAGPTGPKGNPGEKGNNGVNGAKGEKGDRRNNGVNGAKGEKGDRDNNMVIKVSELENKINVLEKDLSTLRKVLSYTSGVKRSGSKFYATKGTEGDYSTARTTCETDGGTLPTPMSRAEELIIQQFANHAQKDVFIGVNDIKQEGVFTYLNGKPVTYANWNTNEPNGKREENCIEIQTNDRNWNDQGCYVKNLVVCEFFN